MARMAIDQRFLGETLNYGVRPQGVENEGILTSHSSNAVLKMGRTPFFQRLLRETLIHSAFSPVQDVLAFFSVSLEILGHLS